MNKSEKIDEKAILDGLLNSAKAKKDRSVRVHIDADRNPWFLLNDIIRTLDLDLKKVEEAVEVLKKNEKKQFRIKGRATEPAIGLSTVAVYYVLFCVNSHYMTPFARWIQHEMLPLIEKAGP